MPQQIYKPETLEQILAQAFSLWKEGVTNRSSQWHTPAVATVDALNMPHVRTVVMRAFDHTLSSAVLRFHTDRRSPKCAALQNNPNIGVHGYDRKAKLQMRLTGKATLHTDSPLADAAWEHSLAMSRVCYGVQPASGSEIATAEGYTLPPLSDTDMGRNHFAAVVMDVSSLEWLYLSHTGHCRARFTFKERGVDSTWLAP
jgi:pyridoxamine 5'-phosphate oxidase